jgi:Protein of unknown function (DUF2848)
MAGRLSFDVDGLGPFHLVPDVLVFAGFASRDAAAAEHHRLELKERGVVVPDKIPVAYRGLASTLYQGDTIETGGRPLMGEVEFVVMATPSGLLVAPGVDLFDEEIEQTDIERSKTTSPTPIAKSAVRLADVREDWDSFKLWMTCDGRLVQQGSVGDMMEPEKLLHLAATAQAKPGQSVLVYSGSMPYVEAPQPGFTAVELGLEGAGRRIVHRFQLRRS